MLGHERPPIIPIVFMGREMGFIPKDVIDYGFKRKEIGNNGQATRSWA